MPKNMKNLVAGGLSICSVAVFALVSSCGDRGEPQVDSVESKAKEGPQSDWPLFRGDPEMQGISVENLSAPLKLAWTYEPNVEEGKRRPPIESTPVISDGRVFVGTQGGEFLALDLESGVLLWTVTTEGPVTAPAGVFGDTVYFGDTYGYVYALNVLSGEELWRYETDGKVEGGVNILADPGGKARVFVGSHDYFLYCFDAATGEVLWKEETGNYIVATPSIVDSGGDQAVSFGGCDGLLYILAADGNGENREIEIGSYIANSAAVRDGIAYLAHNGGEVIAIEVSSGEVVWRTNTGVEYTASPAVDETNVYVAGPDKRLVAYDRVMGEEQWAFLATRSLDSSPVVVGDMIWQGGMDGRLYAVSRGDGSEQWSFELGAQIKSSPAVSRGMLVVCGQDGVVYAFH